DYFSRRIEGGKFSLMWLDNKGKEHRVSIVGPNLRRGSANVMATPPDGVEVGDVIRLVAHTKDTRSVFENRIDVTIKPWAEHREGGKNPNDRKPPDKTRGKDRERPRELATPKIDPVYRDRWAELKFDEYTAMKMDVEYDVAENEIPVFRINMENTPLLNEIKQRRLEDAPARNQFMFANVLVGLSMLLQDKDKGELPLDTMQMKTEDRIEMTCKALAPFMLSLTSLGQEDLSEGDRYDGLESATG
ncbi:MAG TPA: hypothetical protein VN890_06025, partial [Methylocella sp.]|nr:hypothetical protein [Methylocella sp.]